MNYTKEDVMKLVQDEDVEFIRLQFTDMCGMLKNIAITASQLDKALNNKCMFDGSSIDGCMRNEETDMYLYPDLDTFEVFPWRPQQGKVARLICDVYKADGTPFEGDPRYILKKAIKEAANLGYTFDVGPECEFFLFHTDDNGNPTTITHEKAGYFDLGPIDLGENARRDMVLNLESMGFEVETSHHEVAPAQHEIDFKYADALKTADNIMTFKLAIKSIAKRHGLHATFMPKPKTGVNGSGMHTNMSLKKDGKNIFANDSDVIGLSKEAYSFIAGIMKHIKSLSLVANPIVNSYKRLRPGYEAPIYINWSDTNRNPLIRIPAARGSRTRIELRSPDPIANPYLLIAGLLLAGIDGIKNELSPVGKLEKGFFALSEEEKQKMGVEKLPESLKEAIEEFENSEFIKTVYGEEFAKKYVEIKKKEWYEYTSEVTNWEIEEYLYKF